MLPQTFWAQKLPVFCECSEHILHYPIVVVKMQMFPLLKWAPNPT